MSRASIYHSSTHQNNTWELKAVPAWLTTADTKTLNNDEDVYKAIAKFDDDE